MKVLALYIFHQYQERVKHFIDHAIFEDEKVYFLMICNSNTSPEWVLPPYVKTLFRRNKGYDFGGWSDGLLTDDIITTIGLYSSIPP